MFKKILLPTDGSRLSVEVARFAADLAQRHEGVVQPIVAVEYQFVDSDDLPDDVAAQIHERIARRAQKALDQANETIQQAGGRSAGGRIVQGTPVQAILREAEDGEYDLIVIGSRGVGFDRGEERLMGSVTERVLHRTPCPVLVVRAEPRP